MIIRRANISDIDGIMELLSQVLEVHASAYPDIFISGSTKYTTGELRSIIEDDKTPVFVAADQEEGSKGAVILGHAFTAIEDNPPTNATYGNRTLYIDDICVNENERRQHVGTALFEFVKNYASENNIDRITLNVWSRNPGAQSFYEKLGFEPLKTMMQMKL